jgi:hypothetical protein
MQVKKVLMNVIFFIVKIIQKSSLFPDNELSDTIQKTAIITAKVNKKAI